MDTDYERGYKAGVKYSLLAYRRGLKDGIDSVTRKPDNWYDAYGKGIREGLSLARPLWMEMQDMGRP